METVIDPVLTGPHGEEEDDAQALRSQLMAAIEQEESGNENDDDSREFEDGSSEILQPASNVNEHNDRAEHANKIHAHYSDDEVSNSHQATLSERSVSPTREGSTTTDRDQPNSDDSKMMEDESAQDHDELKTEAEMQDRDDNEEFESAASNAEDIEAETVHVETEQIQEEDGQTESSGSDDESDEEADPCMFCNEKILPTDTSVDDPSCAVCRKPAHLACAKEKDKTIDENESWRCPNCNANRPSYSPKETASKPRHSAPRLVRDLLPVSRGVQKPGAHSIFAQPLITDDEGGRALRKRKSPSADRPLKPEKKRKKIKITSKQDTVEVEGEEQAAHPTRRSSQKLALTLPPTKPARILQHRPFHKPPPHKFILAFRLDQTKIENILSEPPRPNRRRERKRKQKIQAPPPYQPPAPKFPPLPTQHLIFPSMFGDRENEVNAKPYGGILTEVEAETSRSLPQMRDREVFEIARKEAEEERRKTSAKAEAEINGLSGDGANTTNSKRTVSGPPSKIKCIQFGKYIIDTSYAAPYPEEYSHESRLFICEFCLKYLPSEFVAWRHKLKCPAKHPPGDEIYRDGSISVWEVDGRKKTEYCQCLCLMAKLFLGSKTLYYDVDPFLFYVLTEYDEFGYHFVGYFSKEKRPASQNNVSCILVMPIHQRKGYATFLIEFSYLLTRIEGKEGSPEKPLSDMGLTAYRSYWDLTMAKHLLATGEEAFSVKDIMTRTGMTADDVVHSLERLYAFIKDPVTKTYAIRYNKKLYESIVEKYESKNFRAIRPERLVWTPYIMGRSDAAILDAQPIQTVAQRDEDIQEETVEIMPDQVSPMATDAVPEELTSADALIDPALLNEHGHVAPGPPPVETMNGHQSSAIEPNPEKTLTNGDVNKDKGLDNLTGYALTYKVEKIPPTRFAIDPPIPPYLLRNPKIRRKSGLGTPQTNGLKNGTATTPLPTRSSPRKATSVNGSIKDQGDSRMTSPDKGSISVRRSGRRSGLVNEVITSSGSEAEDDDGAEQNDPDEAPRSRRTRSTIGRTTANDSSDEATDSEAESSDQSGESIGGDDDGEESEEDVPEESDASDDPDAEIDEDEDEDEDEESQEEDQDDGNPEAASTTSSASAPAENKAEGSVKKKWQPSKMTLYRYRHKGLITDAQFREQLETLKNN